MPQMYALNYDLNENQFTNYNQVHNERTDF